MESILSPSLVQSLLENAKTALSGSVRLVHPAADATTWRLGTLIEKDTGWWIHIANANHLPQFGDLMKPVAISDDGDALLVRDDKQLSCVLWFHDDSPVENLRIGFADWIDQCTRVDVGKLADPPSPIELRDSLVGKWKPVRITTPGHKGVLKCLPTVELSRDGTWTAHCRWPRKMIREFKVVSSDEKNRTFEVAMDEDVLKYWYSFDDKEQLLLAGPQRDFKVAYQRIE